MQNIGYIISGISLLVSLALAYRLFRSDTKGETGEITTVIVKLESIQEGISDIKKDLNRTKDDVQKDHDEIIRMQENQKQLWKIVNASRKVGNENE